MSPKGTPRIGAPRSPHEIEQDRIEAALDAERAEVEYKPKHVELSEYEKSKLEAERTALLEAIRDTRPPRPATDAPAPESISTRVKPEPVSDNPTLVIVPDAQLAEAVERQRAAQETLAAAQAEAEESDAGLVQARADHAAAVAERTLQQHRAILNQALARAQRQKDAFLALFTQYGGASGTNMGKGVTHGPLAKFARTIPSGDVKRRTQLMELYKQAGILMEQIRLGYQAAFRAVEACDKALTIGGTGDYAEFRLEEAGRACEEASAHDASAVEQACRQLIADVKAVDGEPSEIVVFLDGPSRKSDVERQTHAELNIGSTGPADRLQ